MGKPKYIETPDKLMELFTGYKEGLVEASNTWKKFQYVGKDGNRVEDGLKVPMTMEGFKRYGHTKGVTVDHYFKNTDGAYEDYRHICSCIENEIREDQIIGGLLGFYNPSITQRLNGLTEKTDATVRSEQPLLPDS